MLSWESKLNFFLPSVMWSFFISLSIIFAEILFNKREWNCFIKNNHQEKNDQKTIFIDIILSCRARYYDWYPMDIKSIQIQITRSSAPVLLKNLLVFWCFFAISM